MPRWLKGQYRTARSRRRGPVVHRRWRRTRGTVWSRREEESPSRVRRRDRTGARDRHSFVFLRHRHFSPSPTPTMSAQALELLLITYGSRNTDPLGDERYGSDQRRLKIARA
jgi:hypothetical protein